MREQITLTFFGICFGGLAILLVLDYLAEKWEAHWKRERTWKRIEMRCSRERHPSFQVSVFDQDKP